MKQVIWKTALKPAPMQAVPLPAGAMILSAATQDDGPCIWYHCDPFAPKINRLIYTVPTGGNAPPDGSRFIGTVLLSDGAFVVHIFEKG